MVKLRESGIDSSVFTGNISTVVTGTAVRSNNIFTVLAEKDAVSIVYDDLCPPGNRTPATAPRSAIAGVLNMSNPPYMVYPGNSLTFTVTDAVLNTNAASSETYAQVCATYFVVAS